MIISMDSEKTFDQLQPTFVINNPRQYRTRGNISQHNKSNILETLSPYQPKWKKV